MSYGIVLWTWWGGIFLLISCSKRISHISSHNAEHSDHRAVVLFFGFGVFFSPSFRFWFKKRKRIESVTEPADANAVCMRATLIIIKCFVFFRPFQLCSNNNSYSYSNSKKRVKNWRGDDKNNACKIVVNVKKCVCVVSVCLCRCFYCVRKGSSTCISRLCCLIANDIYIFSLQTFWQQEREINFFVSV